MRSELWGAERVDCIHIHLISHLCYFVGHIPRMSHFTPRYTTSLSSNTDAFLILRRQPDRKAERETNNDSIFLVMITSHSVKSLFYTPHSSPKLLSYLPHEVTSSSSSMRDLSRSTMMDALSSGTRVAKVPKKNQEDR